MGNPDGSQKEEDKKPIDLDEEVENAFDGIESHGSGIGTIDPSLRATLPDIDGVIIETAKKISDSNIPEGEMDVFSPPRIIQEETDNTVSDEDNAINGPAIEEDRPTLPPRSNYAIFIEQTGNDDDEVSSESDEMDAVKPDSNDLNDTSPTEIPDEIDFQALLESAFSNEPTFAAEEYASTAKGESTVSQPPLPDLSEEEAILDIEDQGIPEIMIDEASLEEQLLFDDNYMAVSRVLSFFDESGLDTTQIIDKVVSFTKQYGKILSPEEISDIFIIFFKHLSNSLLVQLGKRHKYSHEACDLYSKKMFEEENMSDRKKDKSLVLTLRIIGKMCELYEMKRDKMHSDLFDEFITEQLAD